MSKRYDKIISICDCGDPKIAIKDGLEIQLRCKCDWKRGFFERVRKTVDPDYWEDNPKTIYDWKPQLFNLKKAGLFPALMKIQKVSVLIRIYKFCFEQIKKKEDGTLIFGIDKSIRKGINLFIRGPNNSGRGMMVSTIKIFCAIKEISTTPLPGDFSIFKTDVIDSSSYGKEGAVAKSVVSEKYENVKLLAIESIRGDRKSNLAGVKISMRSRAADAIDSLLVKRMSRQGSVLFTSNEFSGEIGDTLGDKMFEILDSPLTIPILMFHPIEGNALLSSLQKRHEYFYNNFQDILANFEENKTLKSKKTVRDSISEDQYLEILKESFYFNESFIDIPEVHGTINEAMINSVPLTSSVYEEYIKEKKENGLAYYQNKKIAIMNTVRACKELSSKMTDKEIYETGKLLVLATATEETRKNKIEEAKKIRDIIAGKDS